MAAGRVPASFQGQVGEGQVDFIPEWGFDGPGAVAAVRVLIGKVGALNDPTLTRQHVVAIWNMNRLLYFEKVP